MIVDLTLDDRFEITDLLARYLVYTDRRMTDEWIGLFAEGGCFDVAGKEPLSDPAALRAFFAGTPAGIHLASPPVIISAEGDTVRTTQTWLFRNSETEGFKTGYYEDELVRAADGRWRIKNRRVEYFNA